MVSIGLFISIIMNFLMPVCPFSLRGYVWFINGFGQSMLWPPLLRILISIMDAKTYEDTAINMNIAGICGTLIVYLTSSLLWIRLFNSWKLTFYMSASIAFIILIIWLMNINKIDDVISIADKNIKLENKKDNSLTYKLIIDSGFFYIAIAIILHGMLRDGISDWVPSILANTFDLSSDGAIFKAIIIPLIGMISLKITGLINKHFVKEELKASAIFFIFATILCVLLTVFYSHDLYVTLFLSSLIVGIMNAINFFLVGVIPAGFERYGLVSTMSGIINSLTYIGSALSIYGFGFISERYGWNACICLWAIIAALGTLSCLISIASWKRFKKH